MTFRVLAALLVNLGISSPVLAQVTLSPALGGTLEQPPGQMHVLRSVTPAELSITVSPGTQATIQVLEPELVSGSHPDPAGTNRRASISLVNSLSNSNTSLDLEAGITPIAIQMEVERPNLFPAGDYTYRVILNISAN